MPDSLAQINQAMLICDDKLYLPSVLFVFQRVENNCHVAHYILIVNEVLVTLRLYI